MPNEGYRKRLEEWEETQKRMKEQAKEEPYEPEKMRSRAPWGCVALAIGFAVFVMHTLGALAGFWKNIFFKS